MLIETLLKDAFVDNWRVLLMFVILALVDDKFVTDAVVIETLSNDVLVDSWTVFELICEITQGWVAALCPFIDKFAIHALVLQTLLKDAFVDS